MAINDMLERELKLTGAFSGRGSRCATGSCAEPGWKRLALTA
jgi:hypothetical protein